MENTLLEVLMGASVTIAKTAKNTNTTFGMWSARADVKDPAAYVRALRQTRVGSRNCTAN